MRIYGIDPSLKSTGHCVVDVTFDKNDSDLLIKLLTNSCKTLSTKDIKQFRNCFNIVMMCETKSPKCLETELSKLRKKMRVDGPSLALLTQENNLLKERTEIQMSAIRININCLCPSITVMEDYSYHSAGSLTQLAEMKGLLIGTTPILIHTGAITSIKKIGATKGNANKDVMYEYIQRYPIDGTIVEGNDDEIDALAICLTTFYSFFHRMIGFTFPASKNAKERADNKKWVESLDKFADNIGNKNDMEGIVNEKRF